MQSLREFQVLKKQKQEKGREQARLLQEYRDTLFQLRQVRAAFQQVKDPDLVNACVYEMNALQERYSYLLERIRSEKLTDLHILR